MDFPRCTRSTATLLIAILVMAGCTFTAGCKSDSEKARAMLNKAHVLIRDQQGGEAKKILDDLVAKYPHTQEATEANNILDSIIIAGDFAEAKISEIQVKEIEGALQLFSFDVGRYPSQEEGLRALIVNPGIDGWKGPYLESVDKAKDRLAKFKYLCPGDQGEEFSIISR